MLFRTFTKGFVLCAFSALFLAGCDAKREQETQPDELTPEETKGLTLPEKEKLKEDEDNVMNPFPG